MGNKNKKLSDKISIYTPEGVSAEPVVEALKGAAPHRQIAAKKAATKQTKSAGTLVKSRSKGFTGNVRSNINKNLARTIGWAAVGSLGYVLVPTVLQKLVATDLSGWKGFLLGLSSTSIIGLGLNKPEIAVGALAAGGTHLLYSKGSKAVLDLTGVPLYTMADPDNPETQAKLNDADAAPYLAAESGYMPAGASLQPPKAANSQPKLLPYGAHWEYHNGEKVAVFSLAAKPPQAESRFLPLDEDTEVQPVIKYDSYGSNSLNDIVNKKVPNSVKSRNKYY